MRLTLFAALLLALPGLPAVADPSGPAKDEDLFLDIGPADKDLDSRMKAIREELVRIASGENTAPCDDGCNAAEIVFAAVEPPASNGTQICYENPVTDLVTFPTGRTRGFFIPGEPLFAIARPDFAAHRIFVVTGSGFSDQGDRPQVFEGKACYNNDGVLRARDASSFEAWTGRIAPQQARNFLGSPLDDYRRVRISSVPQGASILIDGHPSGAVTNKVLRMRQDHIPAFAVKIGKETVSLGFCTQVKAGLMSDVDVEFRCRLERQ